MNEKKLKILLVTFEFPPNKGGMQNYYYNLIKNLKDIEFTVLTTPQDDARQFDSQQNFRIIRKQLLSKIICPRWLKTYYLIRKIVKSEGINLVWAGDVLPVGSACYLLKYFYKINYFISTHGLDIMLPQHSIRKEKLMLKVLKHADFITANSQFTKKELINLQIKEEKIEIIYPCGHIIPNISPQQLDSDQACILKERKIIQAKKTFDLSGKKVLLTVGRLVERKGQDTIIKAMDKLLKQFPNLVYIIVGEGPYQNSLHDLVSGHKLGEHVIFLGSLTDQQLAIYYQLADLFVMPARNIKGDVEGFGIVFLEANSFGLPVIAGKSGGIREAVIDRQTGLLVDPENQSDVIQKVSELLKNPKLYKKLSITGKERVKNEFSWLKQANKIKERIKK